MRLQRITSLIILITLFSSFLMMCTKVNDKKASNNSKANSHLNIKNNSENLYKIRIEKDIPYLTPNRKEKMDLYLPITAEKNKPFPGIVYIHGGGWMSGDKNIERGKSICTTLAKHGYVAAFIEYKLATPDSGSWPQALYDCKTAVQFLRKNADKYNIDPDHIGVMGGSAGAHLAAMVGTVGPEEGLEPPGPYKGVSSKVQAVVALYGIYNLKEFKYKRTDEPWNHKTLVGIFLGISQKKDPKLWDLASPINHIDGDEPPFLLIQGTADKVVSVKQCKEMDEKLKKFGVPSEVIWVKGAGHSFDLQPPQKDLRPAVLSFLDKYLKK